MTFPTEELYYYTIDEALFEVRVHEPGHPIPETVVQQLWHKQAFNRDHLQTTEGLPVNLLSTGTLNKDSGPDFQHARMDIAGLLWAGAVEIHVYSKYWYQHRHHEDPRYNNTILHVTLFKDEHTRGV